jgi:excisionase family DNA binding protein
MTKSREVFMAAAKTKPRKKPTKGAAVKNGVPESADVLTLAEAAAYLRVADDEIVRLVNEQNLPGRFVGKEWRFLKSALQGWLSVPMPKPSKEAVLSAIGTMKDDPDMDEMLKEIYKQRGRPMTEEEE